jgi:hypothetical protein
MEVAYCPEAEEELAALPSGERVAILAAVEKLALLGDRLPAPHSSAIKGIGATLRELRPRGGRSRWRAFYRRSGDTMVSGSIGPEAKVNPAGFRRAVSAALDRIAAYDANGRHHDEH